VKTLAILAVLIAGAAPAKPKHVKPKPCERGSAAHRRHCHAHRLCSNRRPQWCVVNAEIHYRLAAWQRAWMRRVIGCESGWNPLAYFKHPKNRHRTTVIFGPPEISAGILEFKPSTFHSTPQGRARGWKNRIWEAKDQTLAGAWMITHGRMGKWACR
jgi:hypothetical protein